MGNQDEYQRNFAKNLRWELEKRDMTQHDLAEKLNLKTSSVSSWCSGTRIPRMDKVQLLADYFEIKVSDLLEDRNVEEIRDELFEKKKILFSMSEKATVEDLNKIIAIADMILGGK